ncbi:MAG: hypothetical protein OEV92_00425 [Nitrospinota bacterium]|nr:hypothetical protein [Nitrospinota bacterium]
MIGRLLLATWLLAAAPSPAMAAAVFISPASGPIGAPITARVTVELAEGEKAVFPKPALPEEAELLEIRVGPVAKGKDGALSQTAEYVFTSYKVGPAEFPGVEVSIQGPGDAARAEDTGPASYEIITSLTDPKTKDQLVDIRPPLEMPIDWRRYLAPALMALAAMAAGALLWRYLSGRHKISAGPPPPPPPPAHLAAFERLKNLKEEDLFFRGQGQVYFFQLSEIMRAYVEARYGAPALERTTAEIEMVFDLRFERKDKRERLIELLETCDIFKFTKRQPTREDGELAFEVAWQWVEDTRQRDPVREEK